MRSIFLLAADTMRQNRWLLIALLLWPLLLGSFVWSPHRHAPIDDVVAIVQQEVLYGLAIGAFLASSTIRNEERSRRIVGILSKAVARWQYLLGIVVGAVGCTAIYFLMVSLAANFLLGFSAAMLHYAGGLILNAVLATCWVAVFAIFLSVFLHPVISAAITLAAAYARFVVTTKGQPLPRLQAREYLFTNSLTIHNLLLLFVFMEAVVVFALASKLFSQRDVAVSIE
jgi:hypothetical protein